MTTEILKIAEIAEAQASKHVTHNEGLRRIEGLLVRVLSRANGGPPGVPNNGDTYIVDSATGDWSTASVDDVAHYYGGTWKFYPPAEGIGLWINDEDLEVHYDGARWIATGSARLVVTNQLSVISRTANQPASPSNGDRYIHNGDVSWSVGTTGDVIARIAGAWYAFTPKKGWWTYVEDEQKRYEYDGGWSEFAGGGGGTVGHMHARLGTNQSIAASTNTVVGLDIEDFDPDGWYDPATFRYTPQQAGYCVFAGGAAFLNLTSGAEFIAYVFKNGSLTPGAILTRLGANGNTQNNGTGSVVLHANGSTDFFELVVWHNDSAARDLRGGFPQTFLSAAWLGA